jgi:hypothetical protein
MRTVRRRIGVGVGAAMAVVVLGACGGGGGGDGVATLGDNAADGTTQTTRASKRTFEDAMLDYARCMRRHGVDMPDPQFADGGVAVIGRAGGPGAAGDGPSKATFEAAEKACKPIMDAVERDMPKPSAEEQAAMRDHALAVARCVRAKGFDMPDPTFGDDGSARIEMHAEAGPDTKQLGPDGAMAAAIEACEKENGGPPKLARRTAGGSSAENG